MFVAAVLHFYANTEISHSPNLKHSNVHGNNTCGGTGAHIRRHRASVSSSADHFLVLWNTSATCCLRHRIQSVETLQFGNILRDQCKKYYYVCDVNFT